MAKQDFTPSGVAAKQTELNLLTQTALNTQVGLIQSDLRSWVKDNFNIDSTQGAYLDSIDDNFIMFAANATAFAVLNSLTVSLAIAGSGTLKLIQVSNDIACTFSPGGSSVSGQVYYNVSYS